MTELAIPELCLVVLVGASGSGKSTFAARALRPSEVISSDFCRGLVTDDENDQAATRDAFDVLHYIAGKRLAAGRLTVVDATNVQPDARRQLVELARAHDVLPVAIVLDVPESVCARAQRGARRPRLRRARRRAAARPAAPVAARPRPSEGFRTVHVLHGVDEIDAATIVREPLLERPARPARSVRHHRRRARLPRRARGAARRARLPSIARRQGGRSTPRTRRADASSSSATWSTAGPDTPGVLRLVMGMVARRARALRARQPRAQAGARARGRRSRQPRPGRDARPARRGARGVPPQVAAFCDGLVSHFVLDDGRSSSPTPA